MSDDFLDQEALSALGLAAVGLDIRISRHALLLAPERIALGDHVRIDAFSILSTQGGITVGNHVHIGAYSALLGRSFIQIDDFAGVSPRCLLLTSTDDFSGDFMAGATLPHEYRNVTSMPIVLARHARVGAGSVIMPGVTVGESAAIGAMSLVKADVPPFTIVAGIPARVIRERGRGHVVQAERFLREESRQRWR